MAEPKENKYGAVSLKSFNPKAVLGSDAKNQGENDYYEHKIIKSYYYTTAPTKKKAFENVYNMIKENEPDFKDSNIYMEMNIPKLVLKKKKSEITKAMAAPFEDELFLSGISIRENYVERLKNGFKCAICGTRVPVREYHKTIYKHIESKTYVFCSSECKTLGEEGSLQNEYIDLTMQRKWGRPSIYLIWNEDINKYYVGKTTGTPFYRWNSHIASGGKSAVGDLVHQYKNLAGGAFKVIEMCDEDSSDKDVFERENYGIDFYKNKVGLNNMLNRTALKAYETKKAKIEKRKKMNKEQGEPISLFDEVEDYDRPGAIK